MDSMKTLKQPGIMANLRNRKGFSLIEMAIVLVIIGIIIGAILKGQDLIANSQAKKVVAAVSTWRNLAAAYYDRNGRLPGDAGVNGVIGDNLAATVPGLLESTTGNANTEIYASMTNAPPNPIVVGSLSFWIYFGNVPGPTLTRNAIIICKDALCATALTADELEIIKAIDTAFDGVADAGLGQVRAITAALVAADITAGAAVGANATASITNATAASVLAVGATAPWVTTHIGAIWSFDRPY